MKENGKKDNGEEEGKKMIKMVRQICYEAKPRIDCCNNATTYVVIIIIKVKLSP
jgi:hypothetical protein